MKLVVLSLLALLPLMLANGVSEETSKDPCDLDKVEPMQNFDLSKFQGKWYILSKSHIPAFLQNAVLFYINVHNVTEDGAKMTVTMVEKGDVCKVSDVDTALQGSSLVTPIVDQVQRFYRVIATDYTTVAVLGFEKRKNGKRIDISSVNLMVRDPSKQLNLKAVAAPLKAVCGPRGHEAFHKISTDFSATCSNLYSR